MVRSLQEGMKASAGKVWMLQKSPDAAPVQVDMHIGAGTAA